MSFKILLCILAIARSIAIILFVFLNYPPTREIFMHTCEMTLYEFHQKYLYDNYYLDTIGLNDVVSINEAVNFIGDNIDDFPNIPLDEVWIARFCISSMKDYKKLSKNIFKFILLVISFSSAIIIGLGL